MPDWLSEYRVKKIESEHIHTPWETSVYLGWWKWLTRGMEVLADQDPTLSWHERIQRCCFNTEFERRMRIIPLQLMQGRGLYRPSESRRVRLKDWNGKTQILMLSSTAKKAKLKRAVTDEESSWIYNVCALGGDVQRPLAQASHGGEWHKGHLQKIMRRLLDAAGLEDKLPYDIKYTLATFIFDNPDLFEDENIQRRLARVRAVLGHGKDSEQTELYVKGRWGSEYADPIKAYFNTQKLFPFDVTKYPVAAYVPPRIVRNKGENHE